MGNIESRVATPQEYAKETSLPFEWTQIERITREHPTPFFIYDENGIRETAKRFKKAFSWAPGFINYFAVKALPNPHFIAILQEEGFGADCSSMAELEMVDRVGLVGEQIMFTSNNTPPGEFVKANELGAIINLDDITHLDVLERCTEIPETLCFRFNPGPAREGRDEIFGNPEKTKYGLRKDQIKRAYQIAKAKGVKKFGLHTMIASNERSMDYLSETPRMLFSLIQELHEEGIDVSFVNFGGGVGIAYRPEHESVDNEKLARRIRKDYKAMIADKGLGPIQIMMECGRFVTGPHGFYVARVRQVVEKYRDYVGLDGSTTNMPRVAIYDTAYHHATVLGKEGKPREMVYDLTGSLCENNDKWAKQREMPEIHPDDLVVVHDAGAHGFAMANRYNGQLPCKELLLKPDGSVLLIRREETIDDYFRTIKNFPGFGEDDY